MFCHLRCLASAAGLVTDDKELCELAFQRGLLANLAQLITNITPSEKTTEWEEDEPESISCLREACILFPFMQLTLTMTSQ